ncbi:haloacid dehalogenase-like hydrolase [mine drainage metagenome]|uniref:Haloacid dehalogenase-like hydrolase n=1 Tax=mine drainage metagenome TaxID=410659 RepID=A0A1J5R206_9ZZZZ
MRAAFFDFDHTLIGADSNQLWLEHLDAQGMLPPDALRRHDAYLRDYAAGTLDFAGLDAFRAGLDASVDPDRLAACRDACVRERLLPALAPRAPGLIRDLHEQGVLVAVVSASREALVRPVVQRLGIEHLIAADSSHGAALAQPCFGTGKVLHVEHALQSMGLSLRSLQRSWFYSDSHNDLPLLEQVSDPVAVDPDPRLARVAQARGWPVVSWREAP